MTRPFLSVKGVACETPWQLTALHMNYLLYNPRKHQFSFSPLQMISAHYEEDPESFNEEIRQLDQIREVSFTGTLMCLINHEYITV